MTAAVLDAEPFDAALAMADFTAAGERLKARKPEPAHRRTGSRVKAASVLVGMERGPAPKLTRDEAEMRKRFLRAHAAKSRPEGRRRGGIGSIGWVALAVYDYIVDWGVTNIGGIYPSIEAIAAAVGTDMATVCRANAELLRQGFLDWDRRCVRTGEKGLRGPQVKQTTNFYYLPLPTAAMQMIAAWRRGAKDRRAGRAASGMSRIAQALPALARASAEVSRRAASIDSAIEAGRKAALQRGKRDSS